MASTFFLFKWWILNNNFQKHVYWYTLSSLLWRFKIWSRSGVRKSKKKDNNISAKEVKSVNKNIRSSTRKLKPILRSIVGKKVNIAIRDLTFSEKRISKDIKKTISSAIANAENNFQYDIDKLVVKEAYCGKQIIMKRFRARAKGRAAPILKPYSNVTIILKEQNKLKENHGSKS